MLQIAQPDLSVLVIFVGMLLLFCLSSIIILRPSLNKFIKSILLFLIVSLAFNALSFFIKNSAMMNVVGWPVFYFFCNKEFLVCSLKDSFGLNNIYSLYRFLFNWSFYFILISSIYSGIQIIKKMTR